MPSRKLENLLFTSRPVGYAVLILCDIQLEQKENTAIPCNQIAIGLSNGNCVTYR